MYFARALSQEETALRPGAGERATTP
jgi:hypothetical protein